MAFAKNTAPGLPANIATAATVPCARKRVIQRWLRSRRRELQVLRLKLVQKLLEGHFSCPTGPRHRGKKDRCLLNRVRSSSTINLPPPRVRRRCSELHDN